MNKRVFGKSVILQIKIIFFELIYAYLVNQFNDLITWFKLLNRLNIFNKKT